ncbi:MAG: hypothetical protein JNM68_08165, partial [Dinghuibacter sp.]|nr:hypothetical protein [Dinghuibacter sp.]
MKQILNISILCLFLVQTGMAQTNTFTTRDLKLSLSATGRITSLTDVRSNKNYAKNAASAILSLFINRKVVLPQSLRYHSGSRLIHLTFPGAIIAEVKIIAAPSHFSFELTGLKSDKHIDAVIWGPYTTHITGSIGETIGVVQNSEYTIGLLGLNPKTLGGYPWVDNDHMPQLDIFSQEQFDVSKKPKKWVLYSVEAAKPVVGGSSVQAFTRNRDTAREITNWGFPKFIAPKYDDGGLIGSKIALYGVPTPATLDRIGEIEIAEGLPHPQIDGEWVKKSKIINSSYLIMDFSEETINEALDITQRAGFNYLYHGDPFEAWGHYPLRKKYFPNGLAGLKNCVLQANGKNISIGTHTLTNFINTDDSYVTPIPDERLAKVGYSKLSGHISGTETDIAVLSDEPFKHVDKTNLKAIQIGHEIIRFNGVSGKSPYILTDCQRGAFGTTASEHKAGAEVAMLLDHAYKVFLGNAELNREIAENIADLFNATGIRMLDFDGHEGTHSTGMGTYGEALFAKHWY